MRNAGLRIGKYEIVRLLGRGGMGEVYHARDTVLDREVAIKRMYSSEGIDDETYERFCREARAAARLSHHGIVTVMDFLEIDGDAYIVMELLRGQSLETFMEHRTSISLRARLGIVIQLCDALHYAHERGIVHRDVKPGNIWLMPNGWVKLLDFGVAKSWEHTMTVAGTMVGTIAYMAPELHQDRPASPRSDVFAAGVVLYELVSGRRPFEGDTPTAILLKIMQEAPRDLRLIAPDAPEAVATAVDIALRKDPAARFANAGQMASELRRAQMALGEDDQPLVIADRTQSPKSPSGRRRQRTDPDQHRERALPVAPDPIHQSNERTVVRPHVRAKVDPDLYRPEPPQPASASTPPALQAPMPPRRRSGWFAAAAVVLLAGAGVGGYVLFPQLPTSIGQRLRGGTVNAGTSTTTATGATGTTSEPTAPPSTVVPTGGGGTLPAPAIRNPPVVPASEQIPPAAPARPKVARFRILATPGPYVSCEASIGGWKGHPFDGLTYIRLAPKTYPITILCADREPISGTIAVPPDQPNLRFRDVISLEQ
jgi:eukaryotic-like serine/threonine-protein kinase